MTEKNAELPTKKQLEFAKRENAILKAAISLFEGPRWETVTVEQISRQANIGKGTVYKHFSCKEEIYAHIAAGFFKQLLTAYAETGVSENADKAELMAGIKHLIRISFDMFLSNPVAAKISFYCQRADFRARLGPELTEQFEQLDGQFEAYIGSILQQGIAMGFFPDKPVEHLMMGLEATFDGAVSMIWNGDVNCRLVADQETYVSIISEFMIAGLIGLGKTEKK